MSDKQQPESPAPADRRKNLRNPLPVLKVKVEEGRRAFFGYARNVSRSGFFLATLNPRDPGNQIQVEMTLPEPLATTLRCTCEVVWIRGYVKKSPLEPGMGLKFINLAPVLADAIDAWAQQVEAEVRSNPS